MVQQPLVFNRSQFFDERGSFMEAYNINSPEMLGLPIMVQTNLIHAKHNTVRGLHVQASPIGQGKLVFCVSGSILDVAIDLRKDSPSFGEKWSFLLDSRFGTVVYIPPFFAHGFQAIGDSSVVYQTTETNRPEYARILKYTEFEPWRDRPDFIVSGKDRTEGVSLEQYLSGGSHE